MKKYDVVAFGEILIDFISSGNSGEGNLLYERNAGGAPANVAVAARRLGGRSAFIGMVGPDSFGAFLRETLGACGVETRGMRTDPAAHTTLAFVTLSAEGERSFSFCRSPGADTLISPGELDRDLLADALFLHVGSLSLTAEPARSATHEAIRSVHAAGGFVSYDPNWRPSLWENEASGIAMMKSLMPQADLVKVSDEELSLLYGVDASRGEGLAEGSGKILAEGPKLALVTLGSKGVYYRTARFSGTVPSPKVAVADTTGAGDAFVGGLLYRLSLRLSGLGDGTGAPPFAENRETLEEDLRFACAVAALCVTGRGAIPAMPDRRAVETLLSRS